jgi:GNAT superfamily N-acetyltransferase
VTSARRRIRRAEPTDLAAVRACVRAAYAIYVPRMGREPAPMTADYEALIEGREVWVACDDDTLEGVLVLRAEPNSLLLENVAVTPAKQGRGIGLALIAFAEQHARDLGRHEIVLYTNELMTENLRLYPRLGYVETDRRVEDGYSRVYFRKRITPAPR